MKSKQIKDLPKSIHDRLLKRSKEECVTYGVIFIYYVIERFLYRLSRSKYCDNFILKGAMLFRVWKSAPYRTTRDTDLLGLNIHNDIENIEKVVREIVSLDVPEDGLIFDANGIKSGKITQQAKYNGIRVTIPVHLGKESGRFSMDIGFGDSTFPEPEKRVLETIFESDARPVILCYCKENAVAEKMEAIIWHDRINSRLKDFADLYFLSEEYSFDGSKLAESLRRTFNTRNTKIDPSLSLLKEEDFLKTKSDAWVQYYKNNSLKANIPSSFSDIVARITKFIEPIFSAIDSNTPFHKIWNKTTGWNESGWDGER